MNVEADAQPPETVSDAVRAASAGSAGSWITSNSQSRRRKTGRPVDDAERTWFTVGLVTANAHFCRLTTTHTNLGTDRSSHARQQQAD